MHFYHVSPTEMSMSYLGNKYLPNCRWSSPIRDYPESENLLACLHSGKKPGTMALTLLIIPDPLDLRNGFKCEEVATIGLGKFVCHTRSITPLINSSNPGIHRGRHGRPSEMRTSSSRFAFHTLMSSSSLIVQLPSRSSTFHPSSPSPPARLRN